MERSLAKLTWPALQELVPEPIDTVILPVGTIEAHGPSCLGTDNIIPETIAEGIAERINALVAPTVPYGITRSLARYAGSSPISAGVFSAYIREILDALADSGFSNIVLLNGHGGNNAALKSIAFDFHRAVRKNIAVIHWWELCGKITEEFFGHVGGHGGTDETAMVQAVDPELVAPGEYDPDMVWLFRPGADVYPVPGTILLYKEGEGHPEFDLDRARRYREKIIEAVGAFVQDILARWKKAGY
jgi:creatinine amidohydrolase